MLIKTINGEALELMASSSYHAIQSPTHVQEQSAQTGENFNHLMQQMSMGLPIEPLLQSYPKMQEWVETLRPITDVPGQKSWNVVIQQLINGYLASCKYDLLVQTDEQVTAIDWSIKRNIPTPTTLENSWQTKLKLFLLASVEEIPPENISIIYCFLNSSNGAVFYRFDYTSSKHEDCLKELDKLLADPENVESDKLVVDMHAYNLKRLLNNEISAKEYLDSIPEVEI